MNPDERLRELAIRHAAFAWLDRQRARGNETFTQASTSDLTLVGENIRLMPTQQGIWKPGQLSAALSIRTVYRPEGSERPYDDAVGADGLYRYKMRGDDPNHYQNRAHREAMLERLPSSGGSVSKAAGTALYTRSTWSARRRPSDSSWSTSMLCRNPTSPGPPSISS